MNAEDVPCPRCSGDGAIYMQVRVGQFSTPYVCDLCDGLGSISEVHRA